MLKKSTTTLYPLLVLCNLFPELCNKLLQNHLPVSLLKFFHLLHVQRKTAREW